jgi:splicing suppressor protein 51
MYQTISELELYRLKRFEDGGGMSVVSPVAKLFTMNDYRALSSYGGWSDFFESIPFSMQGQNPEHVDEELHPVMATDSSNMSVTILAALEATIPNLLNKSDLTIHLVGASGREVTHLLLFEDLLHLLPQLKKLHIVLCGPDRALMSPRSTGDLGQEFEMDSCPACTSAGKRKTASIYLGVYHDFAKRPAYRKPDLAVLFHSGRSQEAEESWSPTTRLLVKEGTCTLCTTYTAREATEEVEELDQMGAKLLLRPVENKWRGLVPWPEFLEGEEHSA